MGAVGEVGCGVRGGGGGTQGNRTPTSVAGEPWSECFQCPHWSLSLCLWQETTSDSPNGAHVVAVAAAVTLLEGNDVLWSAFVSDFVLITLGFAPLAPTETHFLVTALQVGTALLAEPLPASIQCNPLPPSLVLLHMVPPGVVFLFPSPIGDHDGTGPFCCSFVG